jgi:septal ring factor EnvC (AmiA/AmiB activator)
MEKQPYVPTSQLLELVEESLFSARFWGFLILAITFMALMSMLLANLFTPIMPVDDIDKFSYLAHPATLFIFMTILLSAILAYVTLSPIARDKKETIENLAEYTQNVVAKLQNQQAIINNNQATIEQYESYVKQTVSVLEQQASKAKEQEATNKQLERKIEQLLGKLTEEQSKLEATLKQNEELWLLKNEFDLVKQFLPFVVHSEEYDKIAPLKVDAIWLQNSNAYIGKCNHARVTIIDKLKEDK